MPEVTGGLRPRSLCLTMTPYEGGAPVRERDKNRGNPSGASVFPILKVAIVTWTSLQSDWPFNVPWRSACAPSGYSSASEIAAVIHGYHELLSVGEHNHLGRAVHLHSSLNHRNHQF